MSENELAVSGVAAFILVGFTLLGFYLIVPDTYSRLNSTDLGAMGNATRDGAYGFAMNIQSVMGSVFLVVAAAAVVIILAWVFRRSLF